MMTWLRDFIRIGTPLFVVPLVLAFYSLEEQNFYWWIGTLFSFVMVADAGVSSVMIRATTYFMSGADSIPKNKEEFDAAQELGDKAPNYQRVIELFHTSRWLYIILAGFLFLILATGGVAATWNLMSLADHRPDLWAAYGVLVLYFTVYMLNIRWSSLMRGLDYVATEARFNTVIISFRIAAWIFILSFGFPPLALTLALLAEGIATHIVLRIFIINWFRKNQLRINSKGSFNKDIFLSMWPAAWRQGGIQLGNFLVERGNSIIIMQIKDSEIMNNFNFTIWILKQIFTFSLTPVYSRLPVLYKLAAEKKLDMLRKSASGYMFLGLSMIAIAYLALGAAGNPLLKSVNSATLLMPIGLFIIMAVTEFLDLHSSFHAGIYTSTNHIPFFWPSIISGAIIFSIGMFILLPMHQDRGIEFFVTGLILTRFFAQLSFNNWYAMFLNLRLLKWPLGQFLGDVPKYGYRFLIDKLKEFNPLRKRM